MTPTEDAILVGYETCSFKKVTYTKISVLTPPNGPNYDLQTENILQMGNGNVSLNSSCSAKQQPGKARQ